MQYMLLIYDNEKEWLKLPEPEMQALYKHYRAFTEEIVKSGHFLAGGELLPTTRATTVRVREGRPMITDGPFAETREQLGGYYLVEAKDLDEATAIAARIPSARNGSIEVRPLAPKQ